MKGYITSKDYSRLYELVEQGYRIAGWIDREFDKDSVNAQKIKTIVEIKQSGWVFRLPTIGYPGRSYEGIHITVKSFTILCESLDLEYIEPKID